MIKTKKQMYLVIGAFALVMLLGGVTYAFFNYTRTGTANTIRVGRIAFNTSQASGQDGAINLSNAFPITRTMAATDNTNAGEVVITITGDTSYSGGVEYIVTATDVTNTVNSKTVPISIIATASNGLGTSDDSYFTNRGGNSSIYKVLANETVSNNGQLLVGYIAPDNNQTGVNGTITIRAYLDSDLVAISDTYNGTDTSTDNMGTTSTWVRERTVLTTTEWNSLQTNGISFKVKIVAQEGTWVTNSNAQSPVVPIQSCTENQCVYINATYNTDFGYAGMQIGDVVDLSDDSYSDNYENFQYNGDNGYWLGLVLDENDTIIEGYVCNNRDTINNAIVCLRGGVDESESNEKRVFNENLQKMNTAYGSENVDTYDDNGDGFIDQAYRYVGIYDNGNITFGDGDCDFYDGHMTCNGH